MTSSVTVGTYARPGRDAVSEITPPADSRTKRKSLRLGGLRLELEIQGIGELRSFDRDGLATAA